MIEAKIEYLIKCFDKGRENDYLCVGKNGNYCWTNFPVSEANKFSSAQLANIAIKTFKKNKYFSDWDVRPVRLITEYRVEQESVKWINQQNVNF